MGVCLSWAGVMDIKGVSQEPAGSWDSEAFRWDGAWKGENQAIYQYFDTTESDGNTTRQRSGNLKIVIKTNEKTIITPINSSYPVSRCPLAVLNDSAFFFGVGSVFAYEREINDA
jgi:hypothetical protein